MEIFASEENTVLISVNGEFIKVWKEGKDLETIEGFISRANDIAVYTNKYDDNYLSTFLTMLYKIFQVETEVVKIETFLDID